MAVPYWLVMQQVRDAKEAIAKGDQVVLEVRDNATFNWVRAKCLISEQPIKGGGAAALMAPWGDIIEEGKWHVKVVEEMPLLEED